MQYNKISEQMTLDMLSTIPDRDDEGLNTSPRYREAVIDELSDDEIRKRTRRELRNYRIAQQRRADSTSSQAVKDDAKANIELAERLEAETMPYTAELIRSNPSALSPSDIKRVDTMLTNRSPALSRLLSEVNIDLDMGLSKNDTDSLLAALLTATESQLETLSNNPSVPVIIKTLIRRLLFDSRRGDTATIERLWDRLFGKPANALAIATPAQQQQPTPAADQGILPSTPVSREAFLILRETLMS